MLFKRPTLRMLTLACLVAFIYALSSWFYFLWTPIVTDPQGVKYNVSLGASIHSISTDLANRDIIDSPHFFNWLARILGSNQNIKAGEYLFPNGTTPLKMLHQLFTGSGMVYHAFTIIPGSTFQQVRANLNKDPDLKNTLQNVTDADVMKQLGHPDWLPEGQFFPDTYYFVEGTPDIIVLKRAFNAMQAKLTKAWQERDLTVPFQSAYQALTAASIIEKEAYLRQELPMIAGVLVNRLRKDMLLQFDPTVIYGMQDRYDGPIHKINLSENTPYNTYVHKGLPPTPICMPSFGAIQATLHPDAHDFLYFVARGDRSHQFSKTLQEHNTAVKGAKNRQSWLSHFPILHRQSQKVAANTL